MGLTCSKVQLPDGTYYTPYFATITNKFHEVHKWQLALQPDGTVGLLSVWFDSVGRTISEKFYTISGVEKEGETAIYLVASNQTGFNFPFRKAESGRIIDSQFVTGDKLAHVPKMDNKLFDTIVDFLQT